VRFRTHSGVQKPQNRPNPCSDIIFGHMSVHLRAPHQGCYAKTGPIKLAWDRVEKNGWDFKSFLAAVRKLPRRQLLALWAGRRPPGQPRRHQSPGAGERRATGAGLHPPSGLRRHQGCRGRRIQYQSLRRQCERGGQVDQNRSTRSDYFIQLLSEAARRRPARIQDSDRRKAQTANSSRQSNCDLSGNVRGDYVRAMSGVCETETRGRYYGFPAHGSNRKHVDARVEGHTVGEVSVRVVP